MSFSFGIGMPREMQRFQEIIEPRLLLPRHVLAAGDGVDDRLVEEIGDHDPQHRAAGGIGKGRNQVARRRRKVIVDRSAAVEHDFGDQRAGIDHDVDQHEQAGEQQERTNPVRLDVRVKTVRRHEGIPSNNVIPGRREASNPESRDSQMCSCTS
jgi:hypothetical protein